MSTTRTGVVEPIISPAERAEQHTPVREAFTPGDHVRLLVAEVQRYADELTETRRQLDAANAVAARETERADNERAARLRLLGALR